VVSLRTSPPVSIPLAAAMAAARLRRGLTRSGAVKCQELTPMLPVTPGWEMDDALLLGDCHAAT
jgi:hypothetical protein